jgi:hypothetical protein
MTTGDIKWDPSYKSTEVNDPRRSKMSDVTLEEELAVLEVKRPNSREQTLGVGEGARTYIQAPLGIVGKLRLFQILADAMDEAVKDDGGKAIAGLFGMNTDEWDGETVSLDDISGSVDMMTGLVKLAKYAPDLVLDVYCVALRIPTDEWNYAKQLMELPVEEGGLNDDDGMDVLELFIDQNRENLKSFFVERIQPLIKKIRGTPAPSASSKRSKATRPSTPKASTT